MITLLTFMFAFVGDFFVVAQATDLTSQIKEFISLIRIIAFVLALVAFCASALLFATGRVESALYGLVAAGLLALSATIVSAAFKIGGDDTDF